MVVYKAQEVRYFGHVSDHSCLKRYWFNGLSREPRR